MDRLFLDANIFFSAAYKPNSDFQQLWKLAATESLTSKLAADQARSALIRHLPAQVPDLDLLLKLVSIVPDPPPGSALPPGIQLPEKDKPILLGAINGQATHLLTGDLRHFGPYFGKTYGGVLILRPSVYLQSRQSNP